MTDKKYELTGEPNAAGLRRIRALRDLPGVRAGDLGGWVASEANLSHGGAAWVYDGARVYGGARVSDGARVYDDAQVSKGRHIIVAGPLASADCTATLYRTITGHHLQVGCWDGTLPEFRSLIAGDEWPEARTEEQRALHRPELEAFAALCEARVASWGTDGGEGR